jgi:hypothetical protein
METLLTDIDKETKKAFFDVNERFKKESKK